jgi:hypothetical protein
MKTSSLFGKHGSRAFIGALLIVGLAGLASCAAPHQERVTGYHRFYESQARSTGVQSWHPGWAINADFQLPPEPGEGESGGLEAYRIALESVRLPFKVVTIGFSFLPPVP